MAPTPPPEDTPNELIQKCIDTAVRFDSKSVALLYGYLCRGLHELYLSILYKCVHTFRHLFMSSLTQSDFFTCTLGVYT